MVFHASDVAFTAAVFAFVGATAALAVAAVAMSFRRRRLEGEHKFLASVAEAREASAEKEANVIAGRKG
jgi:hypothetical protein